LVIAVIIAISMPSNRALPPLTGLILLPVVGSEGGDFQLDFLGVPAISGTERLSVILI
jgi:hypothetical protein